MSAQITNPDELMTVPQIVQESGLPAARVRSYLHTLQPTLRIAQRVEVNGHLENRILRRDYENWLAAYHQKAPFGGALHTNFKK